MKKMFFMMAALSLLTIGFVSCEKDNSTTNNTNTNTNTTPGGGDTPDPNYVPDGYVDLGLPSRVLWATCNIGATAPEEYGDLYAWGETTTKENYDRTTYAHCSSTSADSWGALTKYNTNGELGNRDEKKTLDAQDDAATAALGSNSRMPTEDDWQELLANTTSEWTTVNDVYGRLFTSNSNGNTMFLPFAGFREGVNTTDAGNFGGYWSSSLKVDNPYNAMYFRITRYVSDVTFQLRYMGLSVRAVRSR